MMVGFRIHSKFIASKLFNKPTSTAWSVTIFFYLLFMRQNSGLEGATLMQHQVKLKTRICHGHLNLCSTKVG